MSPISAISDSLNQLSQTRGRDEAAVSDALNSFLLYIPARRSIETTFLTTGETTPLPTADLWSLSAEPPPSYCDPAFLPYTELPTILQVIRHAAEQHLDISSPGCGLGRHGHPSDATRAYNSVVRFGSAHL